MFPRRVPNWRPIVTALVVTSSACSANHSGTVADAGTVDARGHSPPGKNDGGAEDAARSKDSGQRSSDAAHAKDVGAPDHTSPASTTISLDALTANNTSASPWFQDIYTPAARFSDAGVPVSNGDAPASADFAGTTDDLSVGLVSKLPIRSLLYPGATTQIFVETQGWFCTNGMTPLATGLGTDQCGGHIDIGYASNSNPHAALAVADMISRGIDGAIMDWSGPPAEDGGVGSLDGGTTSVTAINTGTMSLFRTAAEASAGKFKIAVLEDEGITACAAATGCDVTTKVLSDIAYLSTSFFVSSAYLTVAGDAGKARPVLFFFALDSLAAKYGKTIDWATVRANAAGDPLFVFENAGGDTHAESNGSYAWINVTAYADYPGSDPFGTTSFLPYYYGQAAQHPRFLNWGSAYKGFDDNLVNGWGGGRRYVGQQCGKTWLDTLALAGAYYSSTSQLGSMQLITWDDYEEGTELETGIDNHVAVSATITGHTLSWTAVLASDAPAECASAVSSGFDITSTLDHFTVYAAPSGDTSHLAVIADGVSPAATSIDLSSLLAAGSWDVYVYASAKPSIHNHVSGAVSVTVYP